MLNNVPLEQNLAALLTSKTIAKAKRIHLATAILWKDMTGSDLVMATHDAALALGARAHGLPVVGATRS